MKKKSIYWDDIINRILIKLIFVIVVVGVCYFIFK